MGRTAISKFFRAPEGIFSCSFKSCGFYNFDESFPGFSSETERSPAAFLFVSQLSGSGDLTYYADTSELASPRKVQIGCLLPDTDSRYLLSEPF